MRAAFLAGVVAGFFACVLSGCTGGTSTAEGSPVLVRQTFKVSIEDQHKNDEAFLRYLEEIEAEEDIENWESPPFTYYSAKRGFYH